MTNKLITSIVFSLVFLALAISFTSALTITEIDQGVLYPGGTADISLTIENKLNRDVEDVSVALVFQSADPTKSPLFASLGTSEVSEDEIREDKSKSFDFTIKASNSIDPGIYSIPYTISYKDGNQTITETGTIGVSVNSKTKLDFIALTTNPVIGQKGKLTLKIINNGFGEVKFVTVTIQPQGYTLLSEDKIYIGSINSDDYETAAFDVIFKSKSASLDATVSYKDFENNDKVENVNLDFKVYTQQEAIENQIITKSNTGSIVVVIIIILLVWFIFRRIRKNRKKLQVQNGK